MNEDYVAYYMSSFPCAIEFEKDKLTLTPEECNLLGFKHMRDITNLLSLQKNKKLNRFINIFNTFLNDHKYHCRWVVKFKFFIAFNGILIVDQIKNVNLVPPDKNFKKNNIATRFGF